MRDNAFGKLVKVLAAVWTALCFAGCWFVASEASEDPGALGLTLVLSWAFWGGIWIVPAPAPREPAPAPSAPSAPEDRAESGGGWLAPVAILLALALAAWLGWPSTESGEGRASRVTPQEESGGVIKLPDAKMKDRGLIVVGEDDEP